MGITFKFNDMKSEKVLVKQVDGINIFFEPLEEYIPLKELLPEENEDSLMDIYQNNIIFCAKVTAEVSGIELGCDYLGGCIYESFEDFYNTKDCYFDDMVNNVLSEAKEELPKIINELNKIKV